MTQEHNSRNRKQWQEKNFDCEVQFKKWEEKEKVRGKGKWHMLSIQDVQQNL